MKMMKLGMRLSSSWRLPNAAERAPERPFDFHVHPPNFVVAAAIGWALKRNDFRLNRHFALARYLSMIFSENRYPLFGIML
jgi:Zn-dependent M28 family amino/carboxypeptidase